MKRGRTVVFGIGIAVCVIAVFFYTKNTVKDAKSIAGKELFTDEFIKSVNSINFRPFDESGIITIRDKEKVGEFFEILRNEKYKFIDEEEWTEGSYQFDFVTNDGLEHIGISEDVIIFGDSQRRAVSGTNLVRGIIKETIH